MRMRRSAALALAFVLSAGFVAACGDDDDSGGTSLEDIGDDSSNNDDSSSDTTEASSEDDSSGGSDAIFGEGCSEFAQAFADAGSAASGAFSGGDGDLGDVADFFDEAADQAPDDVADALRVMGDAYRDFANALDDADIDLSDPASLQDPEVLAVFTEAGQAFSTEEFTAANETVTEFTSNNCEG
jgi:hypothetical protein